MRRMTTTKNIFFKSIKCHTFSEPQGRSDLHDDDDNNDDDDDKDINNDNKEEDDDDDHDSVEDCCHSRGWGTMQINATL